MRCFLPVVLLVSVLVHPGERAAAQAGQGGMQAAPSFARSGAGEGLPQSGDRAGWMRWRERIQGRIPGRQTGAVRAKDATGASGSGMIETIAGAVPFQTPIPALQAGLGQRAALAEDASGNIFIATGNLRTVLKVDAAGNAQVYAGKPLSSGPLAATGDGGPAVDATLGSAEGLAIDSAGNLYISDNVTSTVRVVNAATGTIATVAGIAGQSGHAGDGGPATSANINPYSLTLDGNGNLYIGENNYVRQVNLASGMITTIAGAVTGNGGCAFSPTQSCPATSIGLSMPGSNLITANRSTLYLFTYEVTGTDSDGNYFSLLPAIVSVELSSGTAQLFGGGETSGNPDIFYGVTGIALASDGTLFVSQGSQVEAVAATGASFTAIAGNGTYGNAGDGGPALSAELVPESLFAAGSSPTDFLVGSDLNVRSFPQGGSIKTVAGNGFANYFGDGGPPQSAGLEFPSDVAADGQGNLYVADGSNSLVRKIDPFTNVITTVAGNGGVATSGSGANQGDGGSALKAALDGAYSVAIDQSGHLYIAANEQGIRTVDLNTGVITTLSKLLAYSNIVSDGNRTLYLSVGAQVDAIDTITGVETAIAGAEDDQFNGSNGDGGQAMEAYVSPAGLGLDAKGNLYIAESYQDFANGVLSNYNDIRIVNLSTGIIETFAGGPAKGYSGDGGPALSATLNGPKNLRFDGVGNLLIADTGNNAVRSINLTTNVITTLAGNGAPGYSGDGGNATAAMVAEPYSMTSDLSGNLIVADTVNNRIRRVVLNPTALTSVLVASATNFAAGTSVTFTATYAGLQYGYGPTGSVTFLDGTTALGTGTVAAGAGGAYTATVTTAALNGGQHSITAQYSGDGNYAAGISAAVPVTVTGMLPQSYTVAANPGSLTVAQGASGTAVFTVTPMNGFNQAVSFSCGSGLGTGMSCSFSPASVTPTGTAAVTTTLTVTTTSASSAAVVPQAAPARRWWLPGGGAVVAGLLMLGVPGKRRRVWVMALLLAVVGVGLGADLGCGGSGSGSGGVGAGSTATPAGAYTVTVNASAGSGSSSLSQAVMFTVTVTQ